jgi:nucleotide-binding universal stress UspA family protein
MSEQLPAIVVGFVDSPTGRVAVDRAVRETRLRGARLVVVHSMPGGSATTGEEAMTYRRLLEDLDERLTAEGVPHEVREYVRGNTPADDVCRTAEEIGAILIVVGYRRRSPAGKFLLGSDAQQILLEAPCPVLAVRPDDEVAG